MKDIHPIIIINRKKINTIDRKIILLIEKRSDICHIIKDYKIKKNLPIYDKEREQEIIRHLSKSSQLSRKYIASLYDTIFKQTRKNIKRKQKEI